MEKREDAADGAPNDEEEVEEKALSGTEANILLASAIFPRPTVVITMGGTPPPPPTLPLPLLLESVSNTPLDPLEATIVLRGRGEVPALLAGWEAGWVVSD